MLKRFTMTSHLNAWRQAQRCEPLARMLEALDNAGIPVLVLRGTSLGHTVYPNQAFRVWGAGGARGALAQFQGRVGYRLL